MPYQTGYQQRFAAAENNLGTLREFIKDKLYYTVVNQLPQSTESVHYFTIDNVLSYICFYADFGPSNIAHVVRFCQIVQEKFNNPATANKVLVLCSSGDISKRANASFLICSYMMLVYHKSAEDAFSALIGSAPALAPYRDAGYGPATYFLTVLDCLKGLQRALQLGLFNLQTFNLEEYEFYEKVENGDFNWLTPKFFALAVPKDDQPYEVSKYNPSSKFYPANRMTPLIRYFKEHGIKTIIRLNNKTYDKSKFVENGIEHIELYFPDGSTPPEDILLRFLEICETRPGAIAVHCKAGLGRTGCLIAAFLMKHYQMTAAEVISFLRIIRPGSVVGPQQNFLQALQPRLFKMTPNVKLPQHISMYAPTGFPRSLTRFGPAKHVTLSNRIIYKPQLETQPSHVQIKSLYGEVQEYELQLQRERTKSQEMKVEDLAIPLQPRKHIGGNTIQGFKAGISPIYHIESGASDKAINKGLKYVPRQSKIVSAQLDQNDLLLRDMMDDSIDSMDLELREENLNMRVRY